MHYPLMSLFPLPAKHNLLLKWLWIYTTEPTALYVCGTSRTPVRQSSHQPLWSWVYGEQSGSSRILRCQH